MRMERCGGKVPRVERWWDTPISDGLVWEVVCLDQPTGNDTSEGRECHCVTMSPACVCVCVFNQLESVWSRSHCVATSTSSSGVVLNNRPGRVLTAYGEQYELLLCRRRNVKRKSGCSGPRVAWQTEWPGTLQLLWVEGKRKKRQRDYLMPKMSNSSHTHIEFSIHTVFVCFLYIFHFLFCRCQKWSCKSSGTNLLGKWSSHRAYILLSYSDQSGKTSTVIMITVKM